VGNSGGSIIIWDGRKFSGQAIYENEFAQNVELQCSISGISWVLTNVYAPCTPERKLIFLEWFRNISMPQDLPWLIVGDFNLIRWPNNRNKPGVIFTRCYPLIRPSAD